MRFSKPARKHHNQQDEDQNNQASELSLSSPLLTEEEGALVQAEEEHTEEEHAEDEHDARPEHREGHERGPRPAPEDLTQEITSNDDGSLDITLTGTNRDGEQISHTVNLSATAEDAMQISSTKPDGSSSRTSTISEDTEDGGVDIDVECVTSEGEIYTKHIELDMNEDGTLSFVTLFEHDGEQREESKTLELDHFLGEEDESLSVVEVVEAYLERGHIDTTEIDFSGLSTIAEAEVLVV